MTISSRSSRASASRKHKCQWYGMQASYHAISAAACYRRVIIIDDVSYFAKAAWFSLMPLTYRSEFNALKKPDIRAVDTPALWRQAKRSGSTLVGVGHLERRRLASRLILISRRMSMSRRSAGIIGGAASEDADAAEWRAMMPGRPAKRLNLPRADRSQWIFRMPPTPSERFDDIAGRVTMHDENYFVWPAIAGACCGPF